MYAWPDLNWVVLVLVSMLWAYLNIMEGHNLRTHVIEKGKLLSRVLV